MVNGKKNFKKVVDHILRINFEDINCNMEKLSLFSIASYDQKIKLSNNIFRESHLENRVIYQPDNISNCIYVLKDEGINKKRWKSNCISIQKRVL